MPKPIRKKKKFINKKEAQTFRLIPGYKDDSSDDDTNKTETEEEIAARKAEEATYGIFYDDKYNYMKHLRSLNEQATLVSTESFRIEPDDEMRSNRGGPPTFMEFFSTDVTEDGELDPEILAALEDAPVVSVAENPDEEELEVAMAGDDFLDDDFILKAGGPVAPVAHQQDNEDERDGDFDTEDEEEDFEGEEESSDFRLSDEEFGDEDGRLSSLQPSQGRGNVQDDIAEAQTALILRNFEEGLGFRCSNQMSDDEGEFASPEDYENLKKILKNDKFSEKPATWSEVLDDKTERAKVDPKRYVYEDEDEFVWKDVPPSKPKFDCVSILSLNSNTRNLPTDLIPPKTENQKKRQKSESEPSTAPGLTLKELEQEMRESRRADKASTFRPKDETQDEKKARKKAIKEERKERRQEKVANRQVFAMENEKMKKETASLAKAVKSVKIC